MIVGSQLCSEREDGRVAPPLRTEVWLAETAADTAIPSGESDQ